MTLDQFLELARERLAALGTVSPLRDLRPFPDQLGRKGQREVVTQALNLISQYYVNLALKRAIHATDPEQSLRNLANELSGFGRGGMDISDEEFHERMEAIFVALRDRHTSYELPDPYRRTIAFLPFIVERSDAPRGYFVTKVLGDWGDGFRTPKQVDDAPRVTHWNGVPIAQAVRLNGERNAGANRAARMARGLDRLTFRWLGTTTGPDEEWVDVTYVVRGGEYTQRFEWCAVQATDAVLASACSTDIGLARDGEGEWIRRVKTALHGSRDASGVTRDRLDYSVCTVGEHSYGYLRVFSFDVEVEELEAFVDEVRDLVSEAPDRGLIIDVRGNPGGSIDAAERMIALFAPEPVQLQQLLFRNTPEATTLAERLYPLGLTENLLEAQATAAPYILSPSERVLEHNQAYQGPVLIIFDALTYSAAEVFTAGMVDQEFASFAVGTDAQTGGGGANVWSYELLSEKLKDDAPLLPPLPQSASFNVAVRRITRVGRRNGVALEDLGVVASELDRLDVTLEDLLGANERLMATAAAMLKDEPRPALSATSNGSGTWTIQARDLDRVVVLADGAVVIGIGAPDGQTFSLTDDVDRLTLQGYVAKRVVAAVSYDL